MRILALFSNTALQISFTEDKILAPTTPIPRGIANHSVMNSALANNGANFNDIDNSNEFDSAYTTANTTNNYPSVDPSNDASSVSSHTETSSDDLEPTIVHPTQAPFNREGNGLTRDAHEPVAIVGMGE